MRKKNQRTITKATPTEIIRRVRHKSFRTRSTVHKKKFELKAGPWDGQKVWLEDLPTAHIIVGGWYGRYGRSGVWEAIDAQA